MKKLYLIDVSSLFFRAFYAIRQLNNSKGIPTNALYGFLAAITKILREHKPEGIAFCYDAPEAGFREEIYPKYKANRDEAPEDLIAQFPYLPQIADALSIPGFKKVGFEADDIIGTLVVENQGKDKEVIIVSGDKDFAQLVKPGVKIFDPAKDTYMDDDGVRAKFGVSPNQIIDYLALVGDASDNVPGVRGVGPKGAQKLLGEFGTLEGIYENLDKVKNETMREKLIASKADAFMSQRLCSIRTDVDLKVAPKDLEVKSVNRDLLIPLLEELEFKTLLQRLVGDAGAYSPKPVTSSSAPSGKLASVRGPVEVIVTGDISTLDKALTKSKTKEIWFDVTPRGVGLQIEKQVFRFEGEGDRLTHWLNGVLSSKKIKISAYDTKSVAHQLKLTPEAFKEIGSDVLLEAYCTGKGGSLDFAELVNRYSGRPLPEFAQPEERLEAIRFVSDKIQGEIGGDERAKVLSDIELPLIPVLFKMESSGILIDIAKLQGLSKNLSQEAQSLEKEICAAAGYDFNVGSPKQLGQVLFEKLKLPVMRKTKTGYSTDSDVLEKLKGQHPITDKILEWRELTKLRSTYVDALPPLVDSRSGRIHTSYNQAVTTTGRLSSTHPNLQNIPIRTQRGQLIRDCFIAPQGYVLVSADYSQVELRILAHITKDPALCRAFEQDLDIHTATAAEVFGVKLDEVNADHRRMAKAINFGIAYGMSDFGLAERLGIERSAATDFISRYFKRFPGVQRYMHEIVETGKRQQYVETMFGRRRYYPELNSSNGRLRQMAERATINMPIQGAAADIIKFAMIAISSQIKPDGENPMLLQVHDELVFQIPEDQAEELSQKVKSLMENAVKLAVPVKVSVGIGKNWGAAH